MIELQIGTRCMVGKESRHSRHKCVLWVYRSGKQVSLAVGQRSAHDIRRAWGGILRLTPFRGHACLGVPHLGLASGVWCADRAAVAFARLITTTGGTGSVTF